MRFSKRNYEILKHQFFPPLSLRTLRLNGVAYNVLTVKTKEFAEQTSTAHCSPQERWEINDR